MDTASVWSTLSGITVGSLVAWCVVIVIIITTIVKGVIKLYTFFDKYKQLKEENANQSKLIKEHDDTLKSINESLAKINKCLDEQSDVNLKQVRHTIVHTCYDAIAAGEIQVGKLKSLEEMFDEYLNVFHGNGYVKSLVERVRKLPVVGSLDD
jgi:hypothetical protein